MYLWPKPIYNHKGLWELLTMSTTLFFKRCFIRWFFLSIARAETMLHYCAKVSWRHVSTLKSIISKWQNRFFLQMTFITNYKNWMNSKFSLFNVPFVTSVFAEVYIFPFCIILNTCSSSSICYIVLGMQEEIQFKILYFLEETAFRMTKVHCGLKKKNTGSNGRQPPLYKFCKYIFQILCNAQY